MGTQLVKWRKIHTIDILFHGTSRQLNNNANPGKRSVDGCRLENKNSDNKPWDVETAIENLEAIQALLPVFEKSLRRNIETMKTIRRDHVKTVTELSPITQAIFDGQKKFTEINVPILAIYAIPEDPWTSEAATLSAAFERCFPSARVVRLYNADHFVYRSNEQDVLREMNSFIGDLQ